jgi:hypothetical protein
MASEATGRSMHLMTTPITTECPRHLEPTGHDTFIDDLQPRQLGARVADVPVRAAQQLRWSA